MTFALVSLIAFAAFLHWIVVYFFLSKMKSTKIEISHRRIISLYAAFSIFIVFVVGYFVEVLGGREYGDYIVIGFMVLPWIGIIVLQRATIGR